MRGQSLVIFCASFAFAPPLLALLPGFDNIGVEVISKTSKGKTTLCKWVSSIWGGDPSSELGFMASWLRTLNALEPAMHAHADCLLTLDEGNFAGGGSGDRDARGYSTEAVFRLSGGVPKDRYGSIARPQADRLCWLSNGNVSIVEKLKGADPDVVSAVRARLITLSAQASAEFGVFNRLPPNVANSGAAIDLLNVASTKYYGTPIRAYLTRLARERAQLNDWVRFLVNAYIQEFIEAAGIDRNDCPTLRVAKSFGLIYAAGRLAKLWGILPSTWKIGEAVMQWYRARISAPPPAVHRSRPPAFDQVLDYARRHRQQLFDLRVGKPELNDEAFSEAYGFLKPVDGGGLELLIPPPRMHGEFSDYQSLMKELRHQGRARVEGGRQKKLTTKAAVRRNEPPDRVYCVRVGSALI